MQNDYSNSELLPICKSQLPPPLANLVHPLPNGLALMCFTLIMHNIYLNHCHWLYLYRYLVCVRVFPFFLLLIPRFCLFYIFAGPSPGVVWAVCYVALCPMPRRMVCPAPRQQAAATTTITTSARTASFPPPVPRTWPPLMRS